MSRRNATKPEAARFQNEVAGERAVFEAQTEVDVTERDFHVVKAPPACAVQDWRRTLASAPEVARKE